MAKKKAAKKKGARGRVLKTPADYGTNRPIRVGDAEWAAFVAACERLGAPRSRVAASVLVWFARLPQEPQQLIIGTLAPERRAVVAEQLGAALATGPADERG